MEIFEFVSAVTLLDYISNDSSQIENLKNRKNPGTALAIAEPRNPITITDFISHAFPGVVPIVKEAKGVYSWIRQLGESTLRSLEENKAKEIIKQVIMGIR